eukprot:2126446-Alexandrium_andersonii.AAC.1
MATAVSAVLSALSRAPAPVASAPAPVAVATGPETFDLSTPPGEKREILVPDPEPRPTGGPGPSRSASQPRAARPARSPCATDEPYPTCPPTSALSPRLTSG